MKRVMLIAALAFFALSSQAGISVPVFAKCVVPSSIGIEVCADLIESSEGMVISNFSPALQVKGSIARDLCETFGSQILDYKVKIFKTKSCSYYATRGFFAGGMVSSCHDFGGLSRGTVFSKIKCFLKD